MRPNGRTNLVVVHRVLSILSLGPIQAFSSFYKKLPSLMLFVGFVHVTFSMVWLGTSRYRKAFIRLATDAYLKLKILITLIGLTACHVTTNNRPMKMLKFESCCCTTLSGLSFDFFPFRNSFRNSASIFYFSAAANFLD